MPAALAIAQFALAFYDRAAPLIKAGFDLTAEYSAHKEKVIGLATAGLPPTPEDWVAMHDSLEPHEASVQAAHRDVPGT